MSVFLYLEASQSCGSRYRLGLGCFVPPGTGFDDSSTDTTVLKQWHPGNGVPFLLDKRGDKCRHEKRS